MYTGSTFAETLGNAINDAWYPDWNTRFDVLDDLNDNLLSIIQKNYIDGVKLHLASGVDLLIGAEC